MQTPINERAEKKEHIYGIFINRIRCCEIVETLLVENPFEMLNSPQSQLEICVLVALKLSLIFYFRLESKIIFKIYLRVFSEFNITINAWNATSKFRKREIFRKTMKNYIFINEQLFERFMRLIS